MNIPQALQPLKYLFAPRPFRLEKPVVLQLPIIDICNSQCQMCRIWENKKDDHIALNDLRIGLRNSLFSEVASVGLNGGEPTLRKDIGQVAEVLFDELPKLRSISLITNAYKCSQVIDGITAVGEVVQQRGGFLDVMVSLDGRGKLHDKVRGKPGNFERAERVIRFLKETSLVGNTRIGCTIVKENVYGLHELLEYCIAQDLYIKYRLGVPHQRLYTRDLLSPYALSPDEVFHVAEFLEGLVTHYEKDEHQRFFYRSLIDQISRGASRRAGCDWQHRGATITARGELLYCALESKVLGNIRDCESERNYFGNEPHLQDIRATKCGDCRHDYVGIPPNAQYVRQLFSRYGKKLGVYEPAKQLAHSKAYLYLKSKRTFEARRAACQSVAAEGSRQMRSDGSSAKRVLICGWYGTETLGDKAILAGVLQALRQGLGEIECALVSLFPHVTSMTQRQMPELATCKILPRDEGIKAASDVDLVVFAGGPLMAIDELADMEAVFTRARAHGVPSLIAGCGVGPLGAVWHNDALKNLLRLASARIYRDETSLALARTLGVATENDLVAEDPAFTWLTSLGPTLSGVQPAREGKVLLLGLRDFPYATYARHLSRSKCAAAKLRYEESVTCALQTLAARHPDLVIRPLPMCTNHYGDDDRWFYRRLFRGQPTLSPRIDCSLLGKELRPIDYCMAFRESDAVLAMRFHSLVFAIALDVPAVALDYTLGRGKVDALAARFGVPQRCLNELDERFIVEQLEGIFNGSARKSVSLNPNFSKAVQTCVAAIATPR